MLRSTVQPGLGRCASRQGAACSRWEGTAPPQAGSGIQGSWVTWEQQHPLLQVAEACRGVGREPLGPLCTTAKTISRLTGGAALYVLQFTFLSAVLKTGGLFCS